MPELDQHHDRAAAGTPDRELRRAIVAGVMEVPGVLRIEPGLLGAIRSWATSAPEQEIGLKIHDAGADVTVNVAILAGHQARQVAHTLRERITEAIEAHGEIPGQVEVSVLSIEGAPALPDE